MEKLEARVREMYKNTKIGHLVIGFALLLVLIFFVGYTSYQGMNDIEKKSRAIQNMKDACMKKNIIECLNK